MRLCKFRGGDGRHGVGVLGDDGGVRPLAPRAGATTLAEVLYSADPAALAGELAAADALPASAVTLLAPVDEQEVWAAGVTYKRSEEARERESAGAGQFYLKVYTAPRPELFFKATPQRVVDPGRPVAIRADSNWSVPEPELALVLSPAMKIVGYTIGNDMSSRDIEGENPLYLPQAKMYKRSCSLGPCVTLAAALPPVDRVEIRLVIERGGRLAFEGATPLTRMARTLESLADWLGRENEFPNGAILLTGTGIVPPDDFTLAAGDVVRISITGVGELVNPVEVT